jgi:transposase
MLPFPQKNSVLVMDNAKIHHNEKILSIIEEFGGKVLYLPPYSPDFNPIELAFSVIKSWLRRHNDFIESFENPKDPLMLACAQITSQMARSFYNKSIYL